MGSAPEVPDKVELEDGRWVRVRRVSVGDIRTAKMAAHERGWEDADLDAIGLLPEVIIETSEGDVTHAFVDSMTEADYGKVWLRAKGVDLPNNLAASSTGTARSRSVKVNRTATSRNAKESSPTNG